MFFYEMREDKTMFDTHVHLDDSSFEPDRNKIIENANNPNITLGI